MPLLSSVVQINLVNTDFIWSVTSYSIVLIRNLEKKAYNIQFWIWHMTYFQYSHYKVKENPAVNHFKQSNISS